MSSSLTTTDVENPARDEILALMKELECEIDDAAIAEKLDAQDPLAEFREQFLIPKKARTSGFIEGQWPQKTKDIDSSSTAKDDGDEPSIYLCGNSLGVQPKKAREYVEQEMLNWERNGVLGHHDGRESRPWLWIDQFGTQEIANVVGAQKEEVCIMNTLTTNLHLMMVSFYRPTEKRFKILLDHHAFPSDEYAVTSQVRFHGYDPEEAIITVAPKEGKDAVDMDDILKVIKDQGQEIALVMFAGVQYYSGQFFDLQEITAAGHEQGCLVGFDLAHAVGNVPLSLHDWDVDFAVWCHYKYLNSSPGAIAGAFVHEKHGDEGYDIPRFAGWWSNKDSTRFRMEKEIDFSQGAFGWMLSNPPVLPYAVLLSSLEQFAAAGMKNLRAKSELLTSYLELLLDNLIGSDLVTIITPREPKYRGCQLSLAFSVEMGDVHDELTKAGVVCDLRKPSAMRIAPVPMYNKFSEVHAFVSILKECLAK